MEGNPKQTLNNPERTAVRCDFLPAAHGQGQQAAQAVQPEPRAQGALHAEGVHLRRSFREVSEVCLMI